MPFVVFAQYWDSARPGAAIRAGPNRSTIKLDAERANEAMLVDGWVQTMVPYPTNPAPWNSDVWFRLADGRRWVSFAAVHTELVFFEDEDDGAAKQPGTPVDPPDECRIEWEGS